MAAYQPLSDGNDQGPLLEIGTSKDFWQGLAAQVFVPPLPTWWLLFSNNQSVRRYQGVVTGAGLLVAGAGALMLILELDFIGSDFGFFLTGLLFALSVTAFAGVISVQVRRGTPERAQALVAKLAEQEADIVQQCAERMDPSVSDRDTVAKQAVANAKRQIGTRWDVGVGYAVNLWLPPVGAWMCFARSGRSVSFKYGAMMGWATWFLVLSIVMILEADSGNGPQARETSISEFAFVIWGLIVIFATVWFKVAGDLRNLAMDNVRRVAPPSIRV